MILLLIIFQFSFYESKNIHFVTTEELPPNTLIGDIKPYVSSEVVQTLRISNMNIKTSDYFLLYMTYIKLKRTLDREEVCPKSTKNNDCILSLILIHGESKKPSFITVVITVTDINDNTPRFAQSEVEHTVVENADPRLSDLYLYEAEDPDRQENGTVTYKLVDNNDYSSPQMFRLQISPDNIPRLIQLLQLNYETKKLYNMELIATDDGNPSKTGTLKIRIKVQDINDNLPIFEKSVYEETIVENILVNEKVLEVMAIDDDSEENGKVNYHIAPTSNNQQRLASNFFGIRTLERKGLIYVKNKLDVDISPRTNRFDLMIYACDNGHPQLCGRTTVTIRVIDINDFRPIINVNYLTYNGHNGEASVIPENSVNNYIAIVIVTDKDSGPGGIVECQSTNQNFELIQGINDKDYHNSYRVSDKSQEQQIFHIKNIKEFDREESDHIKFKITCKDNPNLQRGNQYPIQLTNEAEIVVLIDDVNDNPPEFSRSPYDFRVFENRPRPEEKRVKLGLLEATDKDVGSKFYYKLLINPFHAFELTESGELFLVRPFDREDLVSNPVKLVASVSDGKFNQTTSVNILIQDENDLAPVFSLDTYKFNCVENSFSSFVGYVEATDQDSDEYGPIEYRIIPPSPLFSINTKSGMLSVTTRLDREEREFYTIQVLAIDNFSVKEGGRKSGTTTVSITVLDLNDNYPNITFPPPQKLINIDKGWPIGHKVFTMNAVDPDFKENGTVSYKITKDDLNLFNIDAKSGNLFFVSKQPLKDNQHSTVHLTLEATDNGTPLPKSMAVNIRVRFPTDSATEIPDQNIDYPQESQPRNDRPDRKTLIVIIVVALALIVTIIMTIVIIIYQTKMPSQRHSAEKQIEDNFYHIQTKSRNLTPMNESQNLTLDDNFIAAKQFQQSSSLFRNEQAKDNHFEKLQNQVQIDEYQQLMTTPTLLRIWHNNLNQYNELLPSEHVPHLQSPSTTSSPIPIQVFSDSMREFQKPIFSDQSISNNYLQSSFV